MKRSIFLKVFGGYLLIILVLTVLIFILSNGAIRKFHLDTLSRSLENLGSGFRFKVLSYFEGFRFEEMDSFVKEFGKESNISVFIQLIEIPSALVNPLNS